MLSRARKLLMGVSVDQVRFNNLGFPASSPEKIQQLEHIAETFLQGYHSVLDNPNQQHVASYISNNVERSLCGFAFEGAAMGFAILDLLTPWKRTRLKDFAYEAGSPHFYMVIVGAGWAFARLKRKLNTGLDDVDPVFGWLVMDGYGFHEGFFDWRKFYKDQFIPAHFSGYSLKGFDQGLGRALWFVAGADVELVAKMIAAFPEDRQSDLWSGIGLATTYAGGVTAAEIKQLQQAAGAYVGYLAQGSVFAATARHRAGNIVEHVEIGCHLLTGLSVPEAAQLVDKILAEGVNKPSALPKFEVLRQGIIQHTKQVTFPDRT